MIFSDNERISLQFTISQCQTFNFKLKVNYTLFPTSGKMTTFSYNKPDSELSQPCASSLCDVNSLVIRMCMGPYGVNTYIVFTILHVCVPDVVSFKYH